MSSQATKYALTILVDNGETFEGTFDHWQDCFFSFSSEDTGDRLKEIMSFCENMGSNLEIRYTKAPDGTQKL